MKVGIHQPNFLPWIGFFKKLYLSEIFVFLDDVEFSNRSYTKRTKIKIADSQRWLNIPINKGLKINEINMNNLINWKEQHFKTLKFNYGNTKYYSEILELLNDVYSKDHQKLMDFNIDLIKEICKYLDIKVDFLYSSDLKINSSKSDRILDICNKLNATEYISGVGAKNYNEDLKFKTHNINLHYLEIKKIKYEQTGDTFIFGLSIIDLLFNLGKKSIDVIKES
jgi:hypothetical protein